MPLGRTHSWGGDRGGDRVGDAEKGEEGVLLEKGAVDEKRGAR